MRPNVYTNPYVQTLCALVCVSVMLSLILEAVMRMMSSVPASENSLAIWKMSISVSLHVFVKVGSAS